MIKNKKIFFLKKLVYFDFDFATCIFFTKSKYVRCFTSVRRPSTTNSFCLLFHYLKESTFSTIIK